MDGALFRTHDTPELRERFGSGNTSTKRQTPFPMLRLVALMNVRSHIIVDAQVSPSQARKQHPYLGETWQARRVTYKTKTGHKTILTSLPAAEYSAEAIALLYKERWEIELGFRDIKSSMQGNAITLRSKKVDLVYQELWGLLLSYNVIRREAAMAAIQFDRAPSDIRFKVVCDYIAVQLIVMAASNPLSGTGRRLLELRSGIGSLFLERRSRPTTPRTMKISKTLYPVDRYAAPLK
ncbi:hypothetical protein GCM10007877_15690 [Marinibactrum halimedae]|uniref:Transposase IS4-like domain-containing protein n=1 Tax=Marinibactrum halimedae TaxID=1444977 RepID=A0AA37T995_9GAMM|nr:hypothetical protein GCM10007877_15690 [Marinibactrum halimedae]